MELKKDDAAKNIKMSEAEYLEAELVSEIKHEYIDGLTYAMAGAGSNHNRIAVNVASEFRNHLKGTPCETFMADMKVRLGHDYAGDYCRSTLQVHSKNRHYSKTHPLYQSAFLAGICVNRTGYCFGASAA